MINNQIRIRTLVNNLMLEPMIDEHGLSLWIEYAGKNILFDTGQSGILISNAEKLGIDLAKTDMIILSHGHYDHTGGLEKVLKIADKAKIHLHPQAYKTRYSCHPDKPVRNISMPAATIELLKKLHNRVIHIESCQPVYNNMCITGAIPRLTDFEDTGGPFYLDPRKQAKDLIEDDLAMFIQTEQGLVVIVGCAHSGIINTLNYILSNTSQDSIHTVIGGMHLSKASDDRINQTIAALNNLNIQKLYPMHCTGQESAEKIKLSSNNQCFTEISHFADITL